MCIDRQLILLYSSVRIDNFPLQFDITKSGEDLVSFFLHFYKSKSLFVKNLPSWCNSINFLIINIDVIRNLSSLKVHTFSRVLHDCLSKYNIKEWDSHIVTHSDKRLSCYTTFKQVEVLVRKNTIFTCNVGVFFRFNYLFLLLFPITLLYMLIRMNAVLSVQACQSVSTLHINYIAGTVPKN